MPARKAASSAGVSPALSHREPTAQSPAQSPEPRAQSPEPRAQSPEPRAQSPEPKLHLLLLAHRAQINPQLLGFLIKMAALQVQRPCRTRHVVVIVLQLSHNDFALEGLHTIGQRARTRAGRALRI